MKYTLTIECETPLEMFQVASRLNGGIARSWPEPAVVEDAAAEPYVETPDEDPTPETPEEDTTPDSTNAETPSIDDVRAAMVAYTKANSRDDAIELLGQFVPKGVKAVLSNVPEENYGALVAAAS